jgi:hypothetical protein
MTTSDLVAAEDEVAGRLGSVARAAWTTVRELGAPADGWGPEFRALGADPAFVAHAQAVLGAAAARGEAIRTGEVPFVADRAFTREETQVIERALACGLWVDAPWVAPAFDLLADVAVAPTAASSVPSQGVCHAIARAVRAAPTPEAVLALDTVVRRIRHAGLAKKLRRDVGAGRRALALRPEVALRLPTDTPPTKAQVMAWTTTLEACWALDACWTAGRWMAAAHTWPTVSAVSARLVWVADGTALRGVPGAFVGADDEPVEFPDGASVRLWHPAAAAEDERERWRDHVRRHRVDQPLRQVFREHYAASEAGFDDLVCDARQLVGVARTQGWRSEDESLVRGAGPVRAELDVDGPVYPGAEGPVTVRGVRVGWEGRDPNPRWRYAVLVPAGPDRPLPAVPVSELVRSADLLVSSSSVAREERGAGAVPSSHVVSPGGVLDTRRTVLRHVLADLPPVDRARVVVEARHVVVDDHRVHLTTARVTRDGDPVDVEPSRGSTLWMPSADPLLSEVVGLVDALLRL